MKPRLMCCIPKTLAIENTGKPADQPPRCIQGWAVGRRGFFKVGMGAIACALTTGAWAQAVPSPSQVLPPVIAPAPTGSRIALPQVPAGATIPAQAAKLSFRLIGFSVQGEFDELKAAR